MEFIRIILKAHYSMILIPCPRSHTTIFDTRFMYVNSHLRLSR